MTNGTLSTSTKLALLINGKWGLIAFALFVFQLFIAYDFFVTFDVSSFVYLNGELDTGTGKVMDIFETNLTDNDVSIYGYDYVFYAPEGDYYGTSYSSGYTYHVEDEVKVVYHPDKHYIHRIKGMSNTLGGGLFLLPLIGALIWICYNYISGWRKIKIISNGEITQGRLVEKVPTLMQVNDRRVYKLIYAFEANDGLTYEASIKTHEPDKFYGGLIYNKDNPEHSLMLDDLPWNTGYVIREKWSK